MLFKGGRGGGGLTVRNEGKIGWKVKNNGKDRG